MIHASLLALALGALAAVPAAAQSATPTAGDVGSAALRNGYPAGAAQPLGAPAAAVTTVPSTTNTGTAFGTTGTSSTASGAATLGGGTSATSGAGGASFSGGGRGATGRANTASTGGVRASGTRSGGTGGGHFLVCPPGGSSGLAPLFAGTDLSCAPD